LSKKPQITIIGAINIDLIGYPKNKLIFQDDNVGQIETILGGVGRNIAENLARLDFEVEFLSVFADDHFSKKITDSCNSLGISIKNSLIIKNSKTSVFMAIMNQQNDMALGISAMDIYDDVSDSFILDNKASISKNEYCVIETNLPKNILELVTKKFSNIKFALDAVSGTKALKAKSILHRLHILKCNLIEAELLSDIKTTSETDYSKLVQHFIDLGVIKVFITLGKNGLIYGDKNGVHRAKTKFIKPVNTTGAGDSFMAGLILAEFNQFNIHKMAKTATTCAQLTIQHKNTVHPGLNKQFILKNTHD